MGLCHTVSPVAIFLPEPPYKVRLIGGHCELSKISRKIYPILMFKFLYIVLRRLISHTSYNLISLLIIIMEIIINIFPMPSYASCNYQLFIFIYLYILIFPLYSMHREMDEAEAIRPKGNRERKSPALRIFFAASLILKAGILHGRGAPVGNGKGESLWNTVLTGIRTAALRCWGWAVCACPRWSRAAPPSTTRAPGRWWTRPCAGHYLF